VSWLHHTFEATIDRYFPAWAFSRTQARAKREFTERAKELALHDLQSSFSRSWPSGANRPPEDNWLADSSSDADILEEYLPEMWRRCKEAVRDDPYAKSAIDGRADNVIGQGVNPSALISEQSGIVTKEQADRANAAIEAAWADYAEHDNIWIKQREMEKSIGTYGEILAVVMPAVSRDGRIPLSVRVISPDRLETPPEHASDPNVRLGIRFERDSLGNKIPAMYYIRTAELNDSLDAEERYVGVPAGRVFHVFDRVFPGQIRGIPWLSPVLDELHDLNQFLHSHMMAERIASAHAAFIKGINATQLRDGRAAAVTDADGKPREDIRPGSINYLSDDVDITFSDPKRPGNTLEPFVDSKLRGISAGLRYPFALLAKKHDNSYAGGRLELIDGMQAFLNWYKLHVTGVWRRFYKQHWLDKAVAVGVLDGILDESAYVANRRQLQQHRWSAPQRPWIDPEAEVAADTLAKAENVGTEHESVNRRGGDWKEVRDERLQERTRDIEDKLFLGLKEIEVEKQLLEARAKAGLPEPGAETDDEKQPRKQKEPDDAAVAV
jgi:lambda family phage portal protein